MNLFRNKKIILAKIIVFGKLRNKQLQEKKKIMPEMFCGKEKAKEIKLRRLEAFEKQAEKDKSFYLEHAEELNYYLKKKKRYKYRKREKVAFIEECKLRSGGVITNEQKEMLEYIEQNYDDYEERRDEALIETGEVLEDKGDWVCLPMYKYFPLFMSIEDMKNGKTSWNFGR